MAITIEDINLTKFLDKVAPTSFPEEGKLTISDSEFLNIAALLKIEMALERLNLK